MSPESIQIPADSIRVLYRGIPDLLPMQGRSAGDHVSDIIHYMCITLGLYEDGRDMDMSKMQLGCALEHAIAHRYRLQYPGRFQSPGEFQRDGISGTPDLDDILDKAIEEIKLSWISSRHGADSPKLWKFWVQIMCYCHMDNRRLGRLHVCHVNGDYNGGQTEYVVYERMFSRLELIKNWSMIKTWRKRMHSDKSWQGRR